MSDAVAAIGAIITIDGVPIEEVRDITGPELSRDEVDVTNHSSPGRAEEVKPTLARFGAVSFPMNAVPGAPGQQALYAAFVAGDEHPIVLTKTTGVIVTFDGFVSQFGQNDNVTDVGMVDVAIRPTSLPDMDWGS